MKVLDILSFHTVVIDSAFPFFLGFFFLVFFLGFWEIFSFRSFLHELSRLTHHPIGHPSRNIVIDFDNATLVLKKYAHDLIGLTYDTFKVH